MTEKKEYKDLAATRKVRYMLDDSVPSKHQQRRWGYLETLMNEIPGMDNYPADIQDQSFGRVHMNPFGDVSGAGSQVGTRMDVCCLCILSDVYRDVCMLFAVYRDVSGSDCSQSDQTILT